MKLNVLSLFLFLAGTACFAQTERSKVGIRPYPRDKAHEATGGGRVAGWKPGIGNYDDDLKADDYTALHMDAVKGYDGVFRTKNRFFEYYIGMRDKWVDLNSETNRLVNKIQNEEKKGNVVKHIIICREEWLYKKSGDRGPIAGDPRILHQRDVDDTRNVFKEAYALGLLKHDNYKLIQMVVHPAVFLDDPKARAIVKTMDGVCIESHTTTVTGPWGIKYPTRRKFPEAPNGCWNRGWTTFSTTDPTCTKGAKTIPKKLKENG